MAKKAGSGGKQTSSSVSTTASKGLRTGKLSSAEIKQVSASALSQDQTKGQPAKRK